MAKGGTPSKSWKTIMEKEYTSTCSQRLWHHQILGAGGGCCVKWQLSRQLHSHHLSLQASTSDHIHTCPSPPAQYLQVVALVLEHFRGLQFGVVCSIG